LKGDKDLNEDLTQKNIHLIKHYNQNYFSTRLHKILKWIWNGMGSLWNGNDSDIFYPFQRNTVCLLSKRFKYLIGKNCNFLRSKNISFELFRPLSLKIDCNYNYKNRLVKTCLRLKFLLIKINEVSFAGITFHGSNLYY